MTENNMLATVIDPNTKRAQLNLKALPKDVRAKVVIFSTELDSAMREFSMSGLRIGEILLKAKTFLEPQNLFVAWLNSIPAMSKATAYRMMGKFQVAKQVLPPAVQQYALTTGEDLVGSDPANPYGKYASAVEKVGPPPKATGNAEKDKASAQSWVNELTSQYRADFVKATRGKRPYKKLVAAVIKSFVGNYKNVEDNQQVQFVRDVVSFTLANLSLPEMSFRPKAPIFKEFEFSPKKATKGRKRNSQKTVTVPNNKTKSGMSTKTK